MKGKGQGATKGAPKSGGAGGDAPASLADSGGARTPEIPATEIPTGQPEPPTEVTADVTA